MRWRPRGADQIARLTMALACTPKTFNRIISQAEARMLEYAHR
jgi:hypothetical protein